MTKSATSRHPIWINKLLSDCRDNWNRITRSDLFTKIAIGELPAERVRFAIVNFYPLIEAFPQYLGLMLAKVPEGQTRRSIYARKWLIDNLRVEARHAAWFVDFAVGFGAPKTQFVRPFNPPPEMHAINTYLTYICNHGTFAECLAAVNFGMEGPTSDWTRLTRKGFRSYRRKPNTNFGSGTMTWVDAHAIYDDEHVEGALRLISLFARTPEEQKRVSEAAMRSLAYYAMAVESAYTLTDNARSSSVIA